jgi:hypothetical protein
MVEVEVTEEMLSRAQERADKMGEIRNSITKGDGNLSGFLGEEVVMEYLGNCEYAGTYDYDIVYHSEGEEYKVEVKTKRRTVEPKANYTCHIAKSSAHQRPDIYVFCQVNSKENPIRAWVLGWLPGHLFYDVATYVSKGQRDLDGYIQKVNAFVCRVSDLNPSRTL